MSIKLAIDSENAGDPPRLSPRQLNCLKLLARGHTTMEIAAELGISHRTVEQYVIDACTRLDVRTRIEAVVKAVRLGLIPEDPSGV